MILMDVNLLLYAYDPASPFHRHSKEWVERVFREEKRVGLAWMTILAFLRIMTHPRVARPVSLQIASSIVSDWLACPCAAILSPGGRHWQILGELLPASQAAGPLVMDAHLAALAIEHGAVLCTNDRDFARFAGLQTLNPLKAGP